MWDMLESYLISNGELSSAYDNAPAILRAAIKTGIAMTSFHYRPVAGHGSNKLSVPHLGFQETVSFLPASVAVLLFPANFNAPAQICAAATLAALSGVRDVFAISLNGKPADEVIAGLTICGVSDICVMTPEEFKALPGLLPGGTPTIVYDNCLDDALWKTERTWLRVYDAASGNGIVVISPQFFDIALIALLHGIKPKDIITRYDAGVVYDSVFIDYNHDELPDDLMGRLVLGPGCEGFWLLPDFPPEFFFRKCVEMVALEDKWQF